MKSNAFYLAIASIVTLMLGIGLAVTSTNASAPASIYNTHTTQPQPATYLDNAQNCDSAWAIVPPPEEETGASILYGIDAVSSTDIWAVGTSDYQTLVHHWDGVSWSVYPSPNAGSGDNVLRSVEAISSNDVWAVGWSTNADALVLHWDGSIWSVVPTPTSPNVDYLLADIVAVSANDIWAVGSFSGFAVPDQALIMHWNGAEWSIVPNSTGSYYTSLSGVFALSTVDIWAVGDYIQYPGSQRQTLTMHWDGVEWSVVPSPSLDIATNKLLSVTALSSTDVWAVGFYHNSSLGHDRSLALHWDGSAWSIVTTPNLGADTYLYRIDAISSTDVWAVGFYSIPELMYHTITQHWDGTSWTIVPSPDADINRNFLHGLVAIPGDSVWTAGYYQANNQSYTNTLTERYNLVPCTPTPTATPEPPLCPAERFTDVCPTDYFYQHVLDLNDLGVLSGYNTAPPCDNPAHVPCFKPYGLTTRGQMAKIIANAAGFAEPAGAQQFEDVAPGSTFYDYVWRLADRGVVVGYPCGLNTGEPCSPENRPYFRVGANVNRAQMAKFTTLAFGFDDPPTIQTFEDVVPGNHFYPFIENLAGRNIVNGYPCGGPGEPCSGKNLPYFRPGNFVTRGQTAKIVNISRELVFPAATPTPTSTVEPTATITTTPLLTVTSTALATTSITITPILTATPSGTQTLVGGR